MTREREPKAKRERLTELMQGAKRVAVSLATPKKGISSEIPFFFEHGDFSRAQSLKAVLVCSQKRHLTLRKIDNIMFKVFDFFEGSCFFGRRKFRKTNRYDQRSYLEMHDKFCDTGFYRTSFSATL